LSFNLNDDSVKDDERINSRVLGGFLALIALSVWAPMVASGPWRFFSYIRTLVVPVAAGLATLGLLVALVARYRPLTPSRGALVPVGVVVGQVAMLSHDRWLTGFGPAWSEYTAAHLVMVGFLFAVPLGSALKRRERLSAVVALGAVVCVTLLILARTPTPLGEVAPLVGTFLVLGTPAALTGYVLTAGDRDDAEAVPEDRTTATEHRG